MTKDNEWKDGPALVVILAKLVELYSRAKNINLAKKNKQHQKMLDLIDK